jgi:hypothetical protein
MPRLPKQKEALIETAAGLDKSFTREQLAVEAWKRYQPVRP